MKLKLLRWDAEKHLREKPASIMLLLGRRGSGKSVLMKHLAHIYSTLNLPGSLTIGMSPTHETNRCLDFIPESLIYREFDENVFRNVIAHQRRVKKMGREPPHISFWLDDIGYDSSIFKTKTMREVFYNGRHFNLSICIALQYCIDLPTSLRGNTDIVISLNEPVLTNRKRLYEQYFGMIDSWASFSNIMQACCNNYGAIISANNLSASTKLEDNIFWFRANPNIGSFTLGDERLLACDERCGKDEDDIDSAEEEDVRNEIKVADTYGNTVVRRRL